jgi:hypothetical protein
MDEIESATPGNTRGKPGRATPTDAFLTHLARMIAKWHLTEGGRATQADAAGKASHGDPVARRARREPARTRGRAESSDSC